MANAYTIKETPEATDSVTISDATGAIFKATLGSLPGTPSAVGGYVDPPVYSDSSGIKGQYSFDAEYIYMCIADNSWDRFPVTWDEWSLLKPIIVSATIDSTGEQITIVFNQALSHGTSYDDSDFSINASIGGSNISIAYVSGDGTATHIYDIETVIFDDETASLDFTGDNESLVLSGGGYLEGVEGFDIQNNSEQVNSVPSIISTTIGVSGDSLTLVFSEAVIQGSGYLDSDFNLDASVSGSNISIAYSSGNGTDTHVYAISKAIQLDEVVNLDYNGKTNGLEDSSGNDLGVILNFSVTNNSTAGLGITARIDDTEGGQRLLVTFPEAVNCNHDGDPYPLGEIRLSGIDLYADYQSGFPGTEITFLINPEWVEQGQTVTLSYTWEGAEWYEEGVIDIFKVSDGTQWPNFSDILVTNHSSYVRQLPEQLTWLCNDDAENNAVVCSDPKYDAELRLFMAGAEGDSVPCNTNLVQTGSGFDVGELKAGFEVDKPIPSRIEISEAQDFSVTASFAVLHPELVFEDEAMYLFKVHIYIYGGGLDWFGIVWDHTSKRFRNLGVEAGISYDFDDGSLWVLKASVIGTELTLSRLVGSTWSTLATWTQSRQPSWRYIDIEVSTGATYAFDGYVKGQISNIKYHNVP